KSQRIDCRRPHCRLLRLATKAGDTRGLRAPRSPRGRLRASAQAVEHYEMTWYGTLIAWAKQIGRDPNRQPCKTLVKQVFEKLGQAAKGVDCPCIDGIIDEGKDFAGEVDNRSVIPRDRSPPFRLIHLPL